MYLLRLERVRHRRVIPEALVTVKGSTAVTHPIAGSKPRGATPAEDAALEAELLADPKERAEHVMLVDLGRNDLGRVCQPGNGRGGGVHGSAPLQPHHASGVDRHRDDRRGRTALDVVLAAFPAGTLSGAPKVRAMEIIDELEVTRRGLYGGVVGYLDFAGDADAAIAIRTAVLRDAVAYVQAGGGIVADSDPPTEDQETQSKAAAVVQAISVAESFTSVKPSPGGQVQVGSPFTGGAKPDEKQGGRLRLPAHRRRVGAGGKRATVVAGNWRRCGREVHRNPSHGRIESSTSDRRARWNTAAAGTAYPWPPCGRCAIGPRRDGACPRWRTPTAAQPRRSSYPGAPGQLGRHIPPEHHDLAVDLRVCWVLIRSAPV